MSSGDKCRECGCAEDRACVTIEGPCHWVEPDLCSACAQKNLRLTEADVVAMAAAAPIIVELDAPQALMIVSALQLALCHPNFAGPTREFVEWLTKGLIDYADLTPNLKALLEAGWRQNNEPPKYSRLILPSNCGSS